MADDRPIPPEAELDNSQVDKVYDKRDGWTTYVYPDVHTEIGSGPMLLRLCPKYEEINKLALEVPQMKRTEKNSRKSTYCDYLNKLSISVRDNEKAPYTIEFQPKGNQTMLNHPTGTKCRPDIVAVTEPSKFGPSTLHWSHVQATGEEESEGKSSAAQEGQEGAYTAYHLQARPDFVSVPGILVGVSSFKLFFSNAHWVYHTAAIPWNAEESRKLLYAWMWRLYKPECDKSITIDMETSLPTFTVVAGGTTYNQLVVSRAGESIGRRTIVFTRLGSKPEGGASEGERKQETAGDAPGDPGPNSDGSRKTRRRRSERLARNPNNEAQPLQGSSSRNIDPSQDPNIVIKEQYIEASRRFKEGPILKKIHVNGDFPFPGVVRLDHHEDVKNDDREISVEEESKGTKGTPKRVKTRLVLKDRGTPLEKVETMRELLMGVYDLLEVSRILFRKRKILHRDISHTNILYCQNPVKLTESLREDLEDMCFSEYLLEDPATQGDSDPQSTRRRQLATKVLVIDFDCAEDEDPETSPGDPKETTDRTGTLIFMARMVRALKYYPEGMFKLPPMPDVARELLEHYPQERIKAFPVNEEDRIEIPERMSRPTRFKHLLRYDAESVFWYLLWCCVQAQPAGSPQDNNIFPTLWSALTYHDSTDQDDRDAIFITKFPEGFLHPAYRQLEPLLKSMSKHLQGDLSFATDGRRKTDEYLHEAFQRLILNFLSANATERFLDIPKHKKPRGVDGNPMDRYRSTTGKRTREQFEGPPENSVSAHSTGKRACIE